MDTAAQIKALEVTRAAKAAQMETIATKSVDEGRSMDESETEEFDGLEIEINQIDGDLKRMRTLQTLAAQRSRPVVDPTKTVEPSKAGSQQRGSGPTIIIASRDADEKFKGQNFTRKCIAKALAHMLGRSQSSIAQERWGKTNPTLVAIIKANEVAGGGSDSGEWGAELVQADTRYTGDFIEFLYSKTVFDQLPLRQVPANVAIKGQDGTATGFWVGQSKAIPATKPDFSTINLTALKVAAIAVLSNELIADSSPAAEGLVQDALVQASAQRIDTTFLSATAASAGVSPAGILNGVTGTASAGTDPDGVRADIRALYAPFIAAKNAGGLVLVTDTSTRKALQLLVNALGQTAFPEVTAGNLLGDPLFYGDNVPAGDLILLKPSDIYRIGDTGIEVSISRDAMIEQNSVPTGATDTPVAASATITSMFQEESTAIKVVRRINFAKRRASAAAVVTGTDYGAVGSP